MTAQPETPAGQEAEADFWKWLSSYKDEQLGGTLFAHFLSARHLEDAFKAGFKTGQDQP